MKSRFTIAAALALAAATILTVAACGSAVSGSAQANSAAETSSSVSGGSSTSARSSTTAGTSGGKASVTAVPTDLSELTALLSDLPTNVTLPSDLTDLSIPSELTDLNIPGYNSACLSVYSAYASISLALLPALLGGTGSFDAGSLQSALSSIGGNVPPELAPDIQELSDVAAAANGKSLSDASQLFEDPKFTAAQQHIEDWTTANCGG